MVEGEDGLGAGKSKSQRAVFLAVQFETTRVHRWALKRCGRRVGSRLGDGEHDRQSPRHG